MNSVQYVKVMFSSLSCAAAKCFSAAGATLFSVAVTETLRRDVTVRAKSKEEAYAQVERLYSNENIVLDITQNK